MRQLTQSFNESEFTCKCCGTLPPEGMHPPIVVLMQAMRICYGAPIRIKYEGGGCAYRCPDHNRKQGGAAQSQHLKGRAIDLIIPGLNSLGIYSLALHALQTTLPIEWLPKKDDKTLQELVTPHLSGVGIYPDQNFTHLDTRHLPTVGIQSTWCKPKGKGYQPIETAWRKV